MKAAADPGVRTLQPEVDAFRSAVLASDPTTISACHGWTVHDVTAHVVAAAHETAGSLEAYEAGEPVPATREFEEREAPYRALGPGELIDEMDSAFDRLCGALDRVLAAEPEAMVASAGITAPVTGMVRHKRSELSIHRWDIAGDDAMSAELLAQPELTEHAVLLGHLLLGNGPALFAAIGTRFEARLRSPGLPDVVAVVDAAGARLQVAEEDADSPAVVADAAARLLLLWGRRPADVTRVRSDLDFRTRSRLFKLLHGF